MFNKELPKTKVKVIVNWIKDFRWCEVGPGVSRFVFGHIASHVSPDNELKSIFIYFQMNIFLLIFMPSNLVPRYWSNKSLILRHYLVPCTSRHSEAWTRGSSGFQNHHCHNQISFQKSFSAFFSARIITFFKKSKWS